MRKVLALPGYRRLLAAYSLNELAVSIASLALALLVYNRTGSAIGAAGYFLCTTFAPALLSPALVARLDQLASRPVLVGLYGVEAVLFAVLAWVVGRFSLAPVLILALVDGIFAVTARALARAATVSVISRAGLLREGNALTNASFSLCYMAGPAVGGAAVALGGAVMALLVCGGVFAVMALTLATAASLPGAAVDRAPTSGRLRSAVRYVRREPPIRTLLVLLAAAVLFAALPIPVEVVLADHTLHGGAGGYGALLSAWGAGALLGSVIYARWKGLSSRAMIASSVWCLGAGFLVMAVAPSVGVAVGGAAVAGVGNGVMCVATRTALQERVREAWMALVMSLSESIMQGLPGAAILLGGALTAAAGPRAALAVAGIGSLVTSLAVWVMLRPSALRRGSAATSYETAAGVGPLAAALQGQAVPAVTSSGRTAAFAAKTNPHVLEPAGEHARR